MQTAKHPGLSFLAADIALLVIAALPLLTLGQSNPSYSSTTSATSSNDSKFVIDAASGSMFEVKLGQLAQQNGSSSAVKDFGRRMEQEHSKAGDELKHAAQTVGVRVPTDLSKKDQARYDQLAKLKGAQFDRAYARLMVKDHEMDVADFQKEAQIGHNDIIKSFAQKTLPTLQSHLEQARSMERTVVGSTS